MEGCCTRPIVFSSFQSGSNVRSGYTEKLVFFSRCNWKDMTIAVTNMAYYGYYLPVLPWDFHKYTSIRTMVKVESELVD